MKLSTKLFLSIFIFGACALLFYGIPVDQTYLLEKSPDKMINWISVLPPLIVVILAFATGRIILSLFLSVVLGALISVGGNPVQMLWKTGHDYIYQSIQTQFHLLTVFFIITMVGMVAVISRMGGTHAIIQILAKRTQSHRGASLLTAIMGLLIFFDDYANTILVGTAAQPLTDRFKVSREKLAYLVDSTSAPVAGLAVLSTWIGYEIGLFQTVLQSLGLSISGYEAFFYALPFRFYCVFTLVFVFLNILLQREYGGMYTAQKRALTSGKLFSDDAELKTSIAMEKTRMHKGATPKWYNAALPLALVIGVIWVGLYWSGTQALNLPFQLLDLFRYDILRRCFSAADNIKILAWGGGAGALMAMVLAMGQKILSVKETFSTFFSSFIAILAPLAILILAWSMQNVCEDLGTSLYLTAMLKDIVNPIFVPVAIFALAGLIAFTTGTSWGTMAILIPTAIPLTYQLGGIELTYISMAAVLDGAIFGDHCSPVSDTTLMSSIASGCDHMHHVKTQIPYALTCMFIALLCGYLLSSLGVSWIFAMSLGCVAIFGVLMGFGKKI